MANAAPVEIARPGAAYAFVVHAASSPPPASATVIASEKTLIKKLENHCCGLGSRRHTGSVESQRPLLTPAIVAKLAHMTPQGVKRHDAELAPMRDALGHRRYWPEIVDAWLADRAARRGGAR